MAREDDKEKRGRLLMILGVPHGDDGHAAHGGEMSPEEKSHHGEAAMKEFRDAMQRGDHRGMSVALRAHQAIHGSDGEDYEHDDGDAADEPEGARHRAD